MTRHVITALLILTALLGPTRVTAQQATPTAASRNAQATGSAQLEELKVRLATKVAELRSVVKRAMYGTVKSVSLTQATVETKTKDIKIELTDDVSVSQVINGKRTSLSVEDLATDDPITVFGTYDETLDLLKAQFIFIESANPGVRLSGTVTGVDEEEFVVTVATGEGRTLTIDIERTTKTTLWTREGGIVKGGFSRIATGDTVHVVGVPVAKTENRYRASRILDLGNLTGTTSPTQQPTPESSPSATVRPTSRPTPTATP